jgi:tetratricopeptide (TPR) repeat protein
MATLFFMGSFILYVYGRLSQKSIHKAILFTSSVLCWVLSVATKEIALTLPGLIIVFEWFFFQDLNMKWLKKAVALLAVGFLATLLGVYLLYDYSPLNLMTKVLQPRGFSALEHFLTESRVIFSYLSLIAFPYPGRLSLNHDFPVSRSLIDPMTTLLSFAGIFALLVLTILMAKRYRIIAFSLFWFLSNVAIEALTANLELMFEHRAYLPSMLLFLPVVWLCFQLEKPKPAVFAIGLVILVFSLWTYQRNALWNEAVPFWQDAVRKAPNHYRGYANLGVSYLHAKEYGPAQEALEKALSLGPTYPTEIRVNLGLAYLEQGQLEAARENLNRALSLNRNNYVALDLLGTVSRREKNYQEAATWYEQALEINPEFAPSYHNLAILCKETGDTKSALEALERAITLRPMWASAYGTRGLIQAEQGNYALAEASLLKAFQIDPTNTETLFNLAKIYELTTRPGLAARTYRALLAAHPDDIEANHNIAIIYLKYLHDVERGKHHLRRALALDPNYEHADGARQILEKLQAKP